MLFVPSFQGAPITVKNINFFSTTGIIPQLYFRETGQNQFFSGFVMPIYEYRCQECGHEKEALQKISDDPLVDCPECGKPALKKKISAAGFRLSGTGWYETDFKTGSKKNLAGEQKAGEQKSDSGSNSGNKDAGGGSGSTKDSGGSKKAASD
jgi:putative FmdB family regulatory protein